ncbi:MAG: NAD-dependent DNA ligase LigA, partial [Eubacteriales bacterium]|nr:NAD-dependent DNA ligase LigA [Eubacteriales bacterium]
EGIMRKSVLKALNESGTETLKNERNAAAGALRNLDAGVTAKRKLDAFFYNVGYSEEKLFSDHAEMLTFLRKNKFNVNPHVLFFHSIENVIEELGRSDDQRKKEDFLIDGMVIKINDMRTREILGYTEKFPRWALAYKFEAEETTTRLLRVEWQVGRTGKITPLAVVEPVDFSGVTVNKATLNNIGDIRKKDIAVNSRVWLRRSNDVIPQIMGVAEHTPEDVEIREPERCPQCGSPVVHNGAHLFCTNRNCSKQLVEKLAHFASRDAMDIEGFSRKTAEALIDKGVVGSAADLYLLTAADLTGLEGFGRKKTENLLESIEKSKRCTLAAFVFAIGIPNVGKKTAGDLADVFGSLEAIRAADRQQLIAIPDIGETVADGILSFFSSEEGAETVDRLLACGVTFEESAKREGVFSGEVFVLTGTLAGFTRAEAAAEITARGGTCAESVNKSVTVVLYGEKAGSKLEKARKTGIRLMDEAEFLDILNK